MKTIIANWKMYLNDDEAVQLAKKFNKLSSKNKVIICPSFTALRPVGKILNFKKMDLGAQDVFWGDKGPFTGEVSALDLKALKCKYVILGHSERRKLFHETYENVNKKLAHVLKIGLTPILCVGESEQEKKAGKTLDVVRRQLKIALAGMSFPRRRESSNISGSPNSHPDKSGLVGGDNKLGTAKIIVAYEPIWAIGTGNPENPENANRVQGLIKKFSKAGKVLYGGSVDSKNFLEFLAQKNIDGLLVGGASTKFKEFSKII